MSDEWWTPPVDWTRDEPKKLTDLLVSAYQNDAAAITYVMKSAGLDLGDAPAAGNPSARTLWRWGVKAAADAGLIFPLIGVVLADNGKAAYHHSLKSLYGGGVALSDARTLGAGFESIEGARAQLNDALRDAAEDADAGLQTVNDASLGFINAESDIASRRDALRRVAVVEIAGQPAGTGFLVGPDLLLTAAHVLDANNLPPQPAGSVVAVFDFLPDGMRSPAEIGRRVGVVDNNVAGSLPTAAERSGQTSDWNAPIGLLDFALLCLDGDVASDVIDGRPRGFFQIQQAAYQFDPQAHLRIPQHPTGQPLVISPVRGPFDVNANGSRVRYVGNTLGGSSGAPVVDARGRLVAMHHYGLKGRNQGIPIWAIAAAIIAAGVALPVLATGAPDPKPEPVAGEEGGPPDSSSLGDEDPFNPTRFGGVYPFADRGDLRAVIKRMCKQRQRRTLVIDGGQNSGKSYSLQYLTHLEDQREHPEVKKVAPAGLRVVDIDLDELRTLDSREWPTHVMERLAQLMELAPVDAVAQAPRTWIKLSTLIETKLRKTSVIWWIFFDSLDKYVLEHVGLAELIAGLGRLTLKRRLPLRLVLSTAKPEDLPKGLARWSLRDRAKGLTREHVEDWVRRCAKEEGRTVDEAKLAAELDKHFPAGKVPPSPLVLAPELDAILDAALEAAR